MDYIHFLNNFKHLDEYYKTIEKGLFEKLQEDGIDHTDYKNLFSVNAFCDELFFSRKIVFSNGRPYLHIDIYKVEDDEKKRLRNIYIDTDGIVRFDNIDSGGTNIIGKGILYNVFLQVINSSLTENNLYFLHL